MSEDAIVSKFDSSNRSSIHYFGAMLRGIEMYMHMLLELSVQHDIYFGHPDSIEFAEEWMASGVILRWHPTCGDSEKSYVPELVFIWSGNDLDLVPCIRATIYKRTHKVGQDSFEVEFQKKPDDGTHKLSVHQAFEIFLKLNELNEDMRNTMKDDF